jgi:hypothetical protein
MKIDRFDAKSIMAITSYTYNGNKIPFDINGDVILNATLMAKPYGKLVKDWLVLKQTQEYIKALIISREGNSPNGDYQILTDFTNIPGYTRTVQGGKPDEQGTWMHRKIAIRFAQWLNPNFAIWVDNKIEDLLLNGFTSTTREYVTKMIENGQLKLSVHEIKGLHGGTYVRMPNVIILTDDCEWGYTQFTLGNRSFDTISVIYKGTTWIHGPQFLREVGYVTRESDVPSFFNTVDRRFLHRFSPFNKGLARHFISKAGLAVLGFSIDGQANIVDRIELAKRFRSVKEAIPDFEKRLINLIDSVKTLPEKEFLIDLYKLFK